MKIAILTSGPKLYSTQRLREAAEARGHKVRLLDPLEFSMLIEEGEPDLHYKGKRLPLYDAVIPRIGPSITFYGAAVVRQFEQMGVFTLAPSHAISVSRDKLRSFQVLSRHRIGIPPTAFVRNKDYVLDAIELVGGAPVIIKVLEGTQGVGVILAENTRVAQAIIETLQMARQNVLVQRFVQESRGRDLRAFVVGDRVVAAMRRLAVGDEFRSNVHRGGRTEAVRLDESYARTAVLAAQILGLRVAGVDILESADGPKVMEVNSSPGLEGIETTTGIDVADAVVSHLEDQVIFPEVDIRQRLTLKSGYTVAEIPIGKNSPLRGRLLGDTGLSEQEIVVLSILRGGVSFPNPAGSREILAGDRLLCFGKQIALKALIPPASPRRRKPRARAKTS